VIGILLLLACVVYLDMANNNGTAQATLLHPRIQPFEHVYNTDAPPVPVHRFGYTFPGDSK